MEELICSICQFHIPPLKDKNDNIIWKDGNNAWPVNDGRCCDLCNEQIVTPARIVEMNRRMNEKRMYASHKEMTEEHDG